MSEGSRCHSMFDVGCSMLDVRCWMFDVGCSSGFMGWAAEDGREVVHGGNQTADQTFVCVGVSRFSGVKLPFSQHCTNSSVTAFNSSHRARMLLDSCLVIGL